MFYSTTFVFRATCFVVWRHKSQGHIVLDKVFAYKSICWAKEFVMEFVCVSSWTEKCWAAWIDASDIYKKIIANFHQKRAPPFDPYICQPLPQQLTPWLFFCPTDGVRCKYLVLDYMALINLTCKHTKTSEKIYLILFDFRSIIY